MAQEAKLFRETVTSDVTSSGEGRQDSKYQREVSHGSVMPGQNPNCNGFGFPVVKDLPLQALERIQQEAEAGSVRHRAKLKPVKASNLEFGVSGSDGHGWSLVPPASQDACKTADSQT